MLAAMNPNELITRLKRIYASVDALQEFNMGKLPAKVVQNDRIVTVFQDFSGGLSEEEFANLAHSVINNIANLQDHLRRWAAKNGKDKTKVDAVFNESRPLQLIKDLSNNDKHGYPLRGGGYSGLAPKLNNIHRPMRLTTKAEAGSCVVMTFGPGGVPKISGAGIGCAVITGDIVDKDGNSVGDLFKIEQDAVKAWETLLVDFGILPSEDGDT